MQDCSISAIARLLRLAVAMTSSWRHEFPAATAFAVAIVIPLVMRMNSSGVVVFAGGSELLKTCAVEAEEMHQLGKSITAYVDDTKLFVDNLQSAPV